MYGRAGEGLGNGQHRTICPYALRKTIVLQSQYALMGYENCYATRTEYLAHRHPLQNLPSSAKARVRCSTTIIAVSGFPWERGPA